MSAPEWQPCPFCSDPMHVCDGIIMHVVQTPRCPIDMMGFQLSRIDWNRRTPAPKREDE